MRTIRCSSLPMLFRCPGSQDAESMLIESYNAASDLGTAAHDGMRSIVTGAAIDLDLLALRHGVDSDELGKLLWFGHQAWTELQSSFYDAETEVTVEYEAPTFTLVGHVDLLHIDGTTARFLDWKSGRKEETDYYAQLAGYAACLILGHGAKKVSASVVWLRSQMIETYTFTAQDVTAFTDRLRYAIGSPDRYRHGEHCGHCVRSHSCPALIANAHRDIAIFGGFDIENGINGASAETVVDLRRRLKVLEKFADSMESAIRRRVMSDGPLDSGDGYALSLVEENGKREIDALKAWPILQEHLSDEEIADCVTVSAKQVDDRVAQKAGRGNGKAAKEALRLQLEEAGAVVQTKIVKLKEVRQPKQLQEKSDGK